MTARQGIEQPEQEQIGAPSITQSTGDVEDAHRRKIAGRGARPCGTAGPGAVAGARGGLA